MAFSPSRKSGPSAEAQYIPLVASMNWADVILLFLYFLKFSRYCFSIVFFIFIAEPPNKQFHMKIRDQPDIPGKKPARNPDSIELNRKNPIIISTINKTTGIRQPTSMPFMKPAFFFIGWTAGYTGGRGVCIADSMLGGCIFCADYGEGGDSFSVEASGIFPAGSAEALSPCSAGWMNRLPQLEQNSAPGSEAAPH